MHWLNAYKSKQSYKVCTGVIPIWQEKKLTLREIKTIAQGHTAMKWDTWD